MIEKIQFPTSSNIRDIEYDEETLDLTVTFNNSGRYVYKNVPGDTARGFQSATSAGLYLSTYIKGQFDFTKVK